MSTIATPTFNPPVAPDLGSGVSPNIRLDSLEMHAGYDELRSASRWSPSVATLSWSSIDETMWEYLYSFFSYQLRGGAQPFFWTPFDKIASPTGCTPSLGAVASGSDPETLYYAAYAIYHATWGTTLPSQVASATVAANYKLTVMAMPIPPLPAGTAGWRVYVGTGPATLYEQSGSPITDGSETWTMGTYSTGGAPPETSNSLNGPRLWIVATPPQFTRIRPNLWNVSVTIAEQLF
jgi:hypothetical protein